MVGTQASGAETNTRLAIDRTRLAYERTMMAWIRTGTSLISFGFTIYKFFEYQDQRGQVPAGERLIGPREFALIMITTGLVALLMSAIEHRRSLKELSADYGGPLRRSTSEIVGALVAVLGLLALAATLFRA
jgi:putative membrane protein